MTKEITPKDRPIGILVALREELRAVQEVLSGGRKFRSGSGTYWAGEIEGCPVAVMRTGIGSSNARNAGLFLIRVVSPSALISLGFAGGTDKTLRTGDVVVADPLYEPPSPDGNGPRQVPAHPELLKAARMVPAPGGDLRVGLVASVNRVLARSSEKMKLFERHGAVAVEMESLGAARAANVFDTPFICVRVILDEAGLDLPLDFGPLVTPEGQPNWLALLWSILKKPGAVRGLADLQRRAREARERLASYLPSMIRTIRDEAEMPVTPHEHGGQD